MSERRLAMYPERPSEMAESYKGAIKIFRSPPEFELSPEEKADVQAFERALCDAEFPPGYEFLVNRLDKPEKTLFEIADMTVNKKTVCLDWYVSTPKGAECLWQMGFVGPISKEYVKAFLAEALPRVKEDNQKNKDSDDNLSDGYEDSRIWARAQLEGRLREIIENGSSETPDPEYYELLRNPERLVGKIAYARDLKNYYKTIEAGLKSQEYNNVNDAKLVMLTMHRERINTLIASSYRQTIPLLQQYRLNPNILTSVEVDQITDAMPVLKNADTADNDKMARLYSMIDKFVEGIDTENGFGQISAEIERLELALANAPELLPERTKTYDAKRLADKIITEPQMKIIIKRVLASYGLLSSDDKYNKNRNGRAEDGKWQVITSRVKTSMAAESSDGIVWLPKKFKRKLSQKKPTGVLPLLDHEITHVLQHENATKLGIGLLEEGRSARGNLWFETGATFEENQSFHRHFGIDRGANFHYLRTMKAVLAGKGIGESAEVFYDSLKSSGDTQNDEEAITQAVDRTLRLFKHGTEWMPGSGYLTNTQPLEYAEQQILARNMPEDLEWLYFVGRANFQTLAQLHRIGWLKQEDIFIPDKMPSDIALEVLAANELAYSA